MREKSLWWFGHVIRRKESEAARMIIKINVKRNEKTKKDVFGCNREQYGDLFGVFEDGVKNCVV